MSYSIISHRGASLGLNGGTTGVFNSTRGTLIVLSLSYADPYVVVDASMISDNMGNTGNYTALDNATTDNHGWATRLFYIHNPIVGPDHTITVTPGNVIAAAYNVAVFKGSSANPVDVQSTIGTSIGVNTLTPGPITTNDSNELIITAVCFAQDDDVSSLTVNNGFILLDPVPGIYTVSNAGSMAYRIATVSGVVNPTWAGFSSKASSVIASFKDNAPSVARGDVLESGVLKLMFQSTPIAGIADNATSGLLTNLEVSLHTADPGENGDQTTHEIAYTGYARVPVERSTDGWFFDDNTNIIYPVDPIEFPVGTGGSGTATYFGIGTNHTGAGRLLYSGHIAAPGIVTGNDVIPVLSTITAIGKPVVPTIPFGNGLAEGTCTVTADAKNDIGHGTADGLASVTAGSTNRIGTGLAAGSCNVLGGTPGGLSLLDIDDFLYLGYYDFRTDATNSQATSNLTHRYVDDEFRLLWTLAGPRIQEVSITGMSFGDLRFTGTNEWDGVSDFLVGQGYNGIWWDDVHERILSCGSYDYGQGPSPPIIRSFTLNDDGTVGSVHGPVGMEGIDIRRVYGGFARNPAWFQSDFGAPEYMCGWGGYTSLMKPVNSLGPAIYAIPDPLNYSENTDIPATDFRTVSDCSSGEGGVDWYLDSVQTFDRGVRSTYPLNYFDGGDSHDRPDPYFTRPTDLPISTGGWLSPAPDGLGRWTWGDSYYGNACWIEAGAKTGWVMVASVAGGMAWYQGSAIHGDAQIPELQIYDPIHMGEAILGTREVWDVKPTTSHPLNLPGLVDRWTPDATGGDARGSTVNCVNGITYDSRTKRLYLLAGLIGVGQRVYVYEVNGGTLPTPESRIISPVDGDVLQGILVMYSATNCSVERFASGIVIYFQSPDHVISDAGFEINAPPYQRVIDTTQFPNGTYIISSSDHHNSFSITVTVAN